MEECKIILIDSLIEWSIDWLTCLMIHWLIDGLIDWLINCLIDWHWLIDTDWLVLWIDWLIELLHLLPFQLIDVMC